MKIGITSPRFHIGWNTDLKIQSFFLKPGISDDLVFSYCGGLRYSSGLVFQKLLKKIGYDFPSISIRGNRLDSHRNNLKITKTVMNENKLNSFDKDMSAKLYVEILYRRTNEVALFMQI